MNSKRHPKALGEIWKEKGYYRKLKKISGFGRYDIGRNLIALIINQKSEYYGKIGIVESAVDENWETFYKIRFKVGGRNKSEWISRGNSFGNYHCDNNVFTAFNLEMILEKRMRLEGIQ